MKKTIFILLLFVVLFGASGCVKTTVDGEHTGQITAVEKTGVLFKTGDVYFKSDTQSSQEDKYCVENEELRKKLIEYSKGKNIVSIKYHSELIVARWRCNTGDIIDSVELIK